MESKAETIHAKGFNMAYDNQATDDPLRYNKIKVGIKTLADAALDLGSLRTLEAGRPRYMDKRHIYSALISKKYEDLRAISNFFYNTNGIYRRVCNYFAQLYRYDWVVTPEIFDKDIKEGTVLRDLNKVLKFFDNSYIKKICGDIALSVIKNGCYYGYKIPSSSGVTLQELPPQYCRVRYSVGTTPAVEFNMAFFDTIPDLNYRMRVLDLFPAEFKKGYRLFREGKLPVDSSLEVGGGWYLLTLGNCVKFNFNNDDSPMFVQSIPTLIDLDEAQDLDRRKQQQKLLKIIVQKLPMDKNGDLIFDVDEAKDLHNNAVQMLRRAIGCDVITTFADVDSIDMSDSSTTATSDELEKVERSVYNSLGISRNLFNTDGNLSLEKSILTDEGTVRNLLLQFEIFFNQIAQELISSKRYSFKFNMLETTQFNYKELAKLYKEQAQMGYSKLLAQVALGHSQSFILNSMVFENEYLHLSEIMIPPLTSNTINSDTVLGKDKKSNTKKTQEITEGSTEKGGRPEKSDDQKSQKTIQNKESQN